MCDEGWMGSLLSAASEGDGFSTERHGFDPWVGKIP